MLKIENTEVLGWEHAIRGMRNPLNSWAKSDSGSCVSTQAVEEGWFEVGPNDLDLMKRLRNAGTDHRKFMRMITVYVDMIGPLYWWKEFDTYRWGRWPIPAPQCTRLHQKSLHWMISAASIFLIRSTEKTPIAGFVLEIYPAYWSQSMFLMSPL